MTRAARILRAFDDDPRLTSYEVSAILDVTPWLAAAHLSRLANRGELRRVRVTGRGGSRGRKLVEFERVR